LLGVVRLEPPPPVPIEPVDGHDAYQARLFLKESNKKAEMLENRIKRLAFEAQRAQKVTDNVTAKAEKLLEARERHQIEVIQRN
jgi:hypothetical protein